MYIHDMGERVVFKFKYGNFFIGRVVARWLNRRNVPCISVMDKDMLVMGGDQTKFQKYEDVFGSNVISMVEHKGFKNVTQSSDVKEG